MWKVRKTELDPKQCTRCYKILPLSEFYKYKRNGYGIRVKSHCRSCEVKRVVHFNRNDGKEKRLARSRRWHANHPSVSAEKERRRRARKLSQLCSCCTPKSLLPIYEFAKLSGMEVDHIMPLSKGGLHCETNLQLLTVSLNRSKGARITERGY